MQEIEIEISTDIQDLEYKEFKKRVLSLSLCLLVHSTVRLFVLALVIPFQVYLKN